MPDNLGDNYLLDISARAEIGPCDCEWPSTEL